MTEEVALHPDWDLMYRKGLPFGLIAKLCRAPRSTVHLYLERQCLLYPWIEEEHMRNRLPHPEQYKPVSKAWAAHCDAVRTFIEHTGRMPSSKGNLAGERALATWLSQQRTASRDGRLTEAMRDMLGDLGDWETPRRTREDKQRWEQRLTALQQFVGQEHRWPRYKGYKSEEERVLGVWLHAQKQKHSHGGLSPDQIDALTAAAPGWNGVLRGNISLSA